MIQTVKLTSRHFSGPADSADTPTVYTHSDTWISNGHFLIARDNVLNGYLVKPDVFSDNFKRPSTPAHDIDRPLPDFDEFMAFDATHKFRVTRWTYENGANSGDDPVRLLLQVGAKAGTNDAGDDDADDAGSKSISDSHYFCVISDVYADALGLEPGDILEGFITHTNRHGGVMFVLRTEDCTRAVASRAFADLDLEYLELVKQVDGELTPDQRRRMTDSEKEAAKQQATAGRRGRGKARYKIEAQELAELLD